MPLINGSDSKGRFFKYGKHGKKYHYTANNARSRDMARDRALKQGRAESAAMNRRSKRKKRR